MMKSLRLILVALLALASPLTNAEERERAPPCVVLHGKVIHGPYEFSYGPHGVLHVNGFATRIFESPPLDPNSPTAPPIDPKIEEEVKVICDVRDRVEAWGSEEGIRVEEIYKRASELAKSKPIVGSVSLDGNVLTIRFHSGLEFGVEIPMSDDPDHPFAGVPAAPRQRAREKDARELLTMYERAVEAGALLIFFKHGGYAIVPPDDRKNFLQKLEAACKLDDKIAAIAEIRILLTMDHSDAEEILERFSMRENKSDDSK